MKEDESFVLSEISIIFPNLDLGKVITSISLEKNKYNFIFLLTLFLPKVCNIITKVDVSLSGDYPDPILTILGLF